MHTSELFLNYLGLPPKRNETSLYDLLCNTMIKKNKGFKLSRIELLEDQK